MKKYAIVLILIFASTAAFGQGYTPGPGLNTVPLFGSTAKANEKHGHTHHKNHNNYSTWKQPGSITTENPEGASCCNGSNEAGDGKGDCDIVRTYRDEIDEEQHYIIYDGYRLDLTKEMRLVESDGRTYKKSPDGNSHACVSEFAKGHPKVLCWILGDGMN